MLKQFHAPLTFKADDTGSFTCVFSTLGVIDKDGDVTLPAAFKDGQAVRIAQWGHNWGDLPVGKGVIYANEKQAWCEGQFFLDTPHGLATYQTVKGLGDLQEWSYGFTIEQSDYGDFEGRRVRFLRALDVTEVSPVMVGAGVGTRTESIKSAKAMMVSGTMPGSHEELAGAVMAAIHAAGISRRHDMAYAVGMFDDHVVVCLANWDMDGGEFEYLDIPYAVTPEGEISLGEPMPLEAALAPKPSGDTYADQASKALAAVRALVIRSKSLADLRAKEGRVLSAATRERLSPHPAAMRAMADDIDRLLEETKPPEKDDPSKADRTAEYRRFFVESRKSEIVAIAALAGVTL